MNLSELNKYMNTSIENIIANIFKSTFKNPKETIFITNVIKANKKNALKREAFEKKGQHIPVFLISSITNSCNLHCKGCYARANQMCGDDNSKKMLTEAEWLHVFEQANELGVSFILLAGGEPMLRKDVLYAAKNFKDIIFPVFTNGTLVNEDYLLFFDMYRNIIPVLSMEGSNSQTDERRGDGTYDKLLHTMEGMKLHKLLFGVSVTVTTENLAFVTSDDFLKSLFKSGCRLVFYIEYVPVEQNTKHLALDEKDRIYLENQLENLRENYHTMIFLSFPGDEKNMGGCLAAGRGFFHINPYGEAEACPFSPYSDINLKTSTLLEAIKSPLFMSLQEKKLVGGEHKGGCALFENESIVKECLK